MKRKVVKQGESTLMVSLPAGWAQENGVRKGDELEVTERGRSLVVTTQKEIAGKAARINIDDLDPMILRTLAALYKAGCDEVDVEFSDPAAVIAVQDSLRNEVNFEIVEQGKRSCVLKAIEGTLQDGFEPILRRTFILLLTMADESLEALKEGRHEDLRRLRFLEESNNRFTTYLRRMLSKQGYPEHNKVQFIYYIIEELERIADQYKYLFDYLAKPENARLRVSKQTLQCYQQTNRLLRMYYELFYRFEKGKLTEIAKLRKKLINDVGDTFEKAPKREVVILHYLLIQVQLIFEMVEPYLALVLERQDVSKHF